MAEVGEVDVGSSNLVAVLGCNGSSVPRRTGISRIRLATTPTAQLAKLERAARVAHSRARTNA